MFNKNFYPTPDNVCRDLLSLGGSIGSNILEPSAGKGDIVKYIKSRKRHYQTYKIDVIETDPELRNLLFGSGYNVIWEDFLTFESHKEYTDIIMNPPFDEGAKHLLKAIEVAEKQISTNCQVFAIVNAETIKNPFSNERKLLVNKLELYNAKIEYRHNAFSDSERKTDVEVALIYLNVDTLTKGCDLYDRIMKGFKKKDTTNIERGLSTQVHSQELQQRLDDIERYVNEYEQAVKLIKSSYVQMHERKQFLNYLESVNKFDHSMLGVNKLEYTYALLNQEIHSLRSLYWRKILNTKKIRDILTNGGIEKLEKQIAMAENMEINMVNIEMLIMSLQYNQKDLLIDSCVALFERITRHHMNEYSKNLHYYNGWKTNNAFKVNPKIIIPINYGGFDLMFGAWIKDSYNKIDYKIKSLIDDIVRMMQLFNSEINNEFETDGNNEFETDWLKFKIFKKGTIHIWFKDLDTLSKFNYVCGQHFNWLPQEEEMNDPKAKEFVMKEFGNINTENLLSYAI